MSEFCVEHPHQTRCRVAHLLDQPDLVGRRAERYNTGFSEVKETQVFGLNLCLLCGLQQARTGLCSAIQRSCVWGKPLNGWGKDAQPFLVGPSLKGVVCRQLDSFLGADLGLSIPARSVY